MANPARATLTDLANMGPAQSRIAPWVAANPVPAQAFLNSGSDFLDGYLTAQFDLPLVAPYTQDVIDFEVMFASYRIILRLGLDPRSPTDMLIVEEYKAKLAWADLIGRQQITPAMADSSTDSAQGGLSWSPRRRVGIRSAGLTTTRRRISRAIRLWTTSNGGSVQHACNDAHTIPWWNIGQVRRRIHIGTGSTPPVRHDCSARWPMGGACLRAVPRS